MDQRTVGEVMTADPVSIGSRQTLVEAAKLMRDHDIGDVIVTGDSAPMGIITDRDIVVRAIAEGRDIITTEVGDVCSHDVATVRPEESIEMAIEVMRSRAVRRVPVVSDGRIVGVVCLGDLAVERDPRSALADISKAAPNN